MEKGLKIGFKNFKKFQDFPMIELAPITLLVGPNNSGKSSFIKAFTFLFSNLDSQPKSKVILPPFVKQVSFRQDTVAHFEWGDFSTTLNRGQEAHEISFCWELEDTFYNFNFGASKEEISDNPSLLATLPINSFIVKNDKLGIVIENSLIDDKCSTIFKITPKIMQKWLKDSIRNLESDIQKWKHYAIFISHNSSKGTTVASDEEARLDEYKQAEKILEEQDAGDYILLELKDDRLGEREIQLNKKIQEAKFLTNFLESEKDHNPVNVPHIYIDDESIYKATGPVKAEILKDYCNHCVNCISGNRNSLEKSTIFPDFTYIETHNAPHSLAINKEDKNSFLAQTIADFYSKVPQNKDSSTHSWVVKWIKEDKGFGFGNDFEISTHFGGEIFAVNIVKKDEIIPLGTLGTGAIQVFVLLLKLATILSTIGKDENIIVLLEEPEQNLHPALQSKLAEFFLEVYEKSGHRIHFVIETHSEYLIRKTQVMVADEKYAGVKKDAPFKVYYFPKEGLPYDMKYRVDGRFKKAFDKGFFDEASNLAIRLFKL